MPIFEYDCLNCGERFDELIMDREEEKDLTCPSCSSDNIERRFSSFSLTSSDPEKFANDPSAQRDKVQEKMEQPKVGMEYLDQFFR